MDRVQAQLAAVEATKQSAEDSRNSVVGEAVSHLYTALIHVVTIVDVLSWSKLKLNSIW